MTSPNGESPAPRKHPGGRPRKDIDSGVLMRLLGEGNSIRETARMMKRGYGSVHRALQALRHKDTDPKLRNLIQNTGE